MKYLFLLSFLICSVGLVSFPVMVKCQTGSAAKTKTILFEGVIVAGYVDHGAYLNCTGPGIKFTAKPITLLLGLLPGLRIKEDKVQPGSSKNSMVTPSLGFGLTTSLKHFVLQVPFYYNSKTASKDGKWNPGIGLGYKF